MTFTFDNSYSRLPAGMFTRQTATPVPAPALIAVNVALGAELGVDADWLASDAALQVFAGNVVPEGADPLAQAYAGHQFGGWNPGLGDGRALLLGEVMGRDIQLKGSGPTPYSRRGDGRAWLGPVMREYIVSEAMHALGVPTTRALAAVTTGETIWREGSKPGAILTRVAASHIRVGTFQLFAAKGDLGALRALYDHVVARHYPNAKTPADLLEAVMKNQAVLIAKWMGLGFVHGVMNTDNVSVAGETIDYGPCAFMDDYHADSVFSAIDQQGRYAYANQPRIAVWNLAQFATALIPLMDNQEAAIEQFTAIINQFPDLYEAEWIKVFGAKLTIVDPSEADRDLITDLLALLQKDGADFTNVFAHLAGDAAQDQFVDRAAFQKWFARWETRRAGDFATRMAAVNPKIIPRNHQVEAVIQAGVAGDLAPFHALLAAATQPFAPLTDATEGFAKAPSRAERVTQTFCGT